MAIENTFKFILSWAAWPGLFAVCMIITYYGFSYDHPVMFFNIAYAPLIISLFALEIYMPHEREWLKPDGQTFVNIAHTLSSKGIVQALMIFGGVVGIAAITGPVSEQGYSIWPRRWPMAIQVSLGVIAAEFALYWAHRLAHEWKPLWRFHAIHHSATRLWIINTGRFHFIDSLFSIVLAIIILVALDAPLEVVKWLSAVTAFIGMLTHCNVDMRFGALSWVFNTPGLHRWHHSRKLKESDNNYGENLMLWDHIFGTYFNPNRRPPVNIGISEFMPLRFMHQIIWPFITQSRKNKIQSEYAGPV